MLLSRYYSWYLPWSTTVKHMTSVQRVAEMIHISVKLGTIPTAATLTILPMLLWQIPRNLTSGYRVKRIQHFLVIIFIMKYATFKMNRHLIYSRVGTAAVAEAARVKIWTSPCKTSTSAESVF